MNEYDNDNDELEDYSSGNSFRARSNTWPLNKPDLSAPSSNVCIDEPLPEIELEEDDLFTTNENWTAGFVDHDIMSWDPILNAQNQHQAPNQPAVIHHQPQQQTTNISNRTNEQQSHRTSQGHQRQQSIHLIQHQQVLTHHQSQQHLDQQHCSPPTASIEQHHTNQHRHHQQIGNSSHHIGQRQDLDSFLDGGGSGAMIGAQNAAPIQPQQQEQQQEQQQQIQQQTLDSSRCLDADDPSDYHIHQLHHLRLDGTNDPQQEHYPATVTNIPDGSDASPSQISSLNMHLGHPVNEYTGMSINTDQHHHHHHHHHHSNPQSHLQPLTSARFDFDHQQPPGDYDVKLAQDDNISSQHHHLNQLDHHQHPKLHEHSRHTNPRHQFDHHHNPQHQHAQPQHHHQYHDLTTSSLDNGNCGSHILPSSLNTSGIGLSTDLEDLDFKPTNTSSILSNSYDDPLQHQHLQDQPQQSELQSKSSETVKSELQSSSVAAKQTDSNSASKAKLNAPRRNAWGNMSYADLISQAIESTNDKRLTLSQIYDWMVQHVPYFKDKGDSNSSAGWKNSVRHNLSLHSRFKRLQNEGTGKSSWWTINPEANIGKCARRRAASMEASKYEKKRGRAKKRAEAIRQGLVSYPSLTNPSLNGSTDVLGEQQSQAQTISHFHTTTTAIQQEVSSKQASQEHLQPSDQFVNQQHQSYQQLQMPPLHIQTLENYNIDQPSQQQQQHLRQLQQADRQERHQQNCSDNNNTLRLYCLPSVSH